jgi:uncharacterized membrane protein
MLVLSWDEPHSYLKLLEVLHLIWTETFSRAQRPSRAIHYLISLTNMQFYLSALLLFLPSVLSIPVGDALLNALSPSTPLLNAHDKRDPAPKDKCQQPIGQNLCTSGVPYCCSGTGTSQVCGPAGTVECTSIAICCINTNGVCLSFLVGL